ncbi:MAG: DUF1080 domain-containing protein [Planctomycetes bacterium]|nr:DUF1080 domain-containing protein [Planctomycetota bacterium]
MQSVVECAVRWPSRPFCGKLGLAFCLIGLVGLGGCSAPTDTSSGAPSSQEVASQSESPSAAPATSKKAGDRSRSNRETASKGERSQETSGPPPKPLLSAEELREGWFQLFDGQTLYGWQADNDVNWSVRDGVITADTGPLGLLLTTVPFADFELRLDFRLEKGGNSGVILRSPLEPKDPARDCYELNLCDSHKTYPTGSFVGRVRIDSPVSVEGEWHTYHVRAEGNRFRVKLDGKPILDFQDTSDAVVRAGRIALQKNKGKIEFRNIFVRPLGMQSLFNGRDLTGWRVVPGSKSTFSVEDGTIRVKNGPGFLETEGTWADFILQWEAITYGDELNSGVFFRAMPGTEEAPSNGYEVQIHNGFKDGDRSQPSNAGTGAIFRRTTARWVIPNDREWFTVTLIAHGAHIATWVNGIQVTDWTDTRRPDENPRRGLRLKAGHISLQGHDPTTDLAFRGFRIAPLPASP